MQKYKFFLIFLIQLIKKPSLKFCKFCKLIIIYFLIFRHRAFSMQALKSLVMFYKVPVFFKFLSQKLNNNFCFLEADTIGKDGKTSHNYDAKIFMLYLNNAGLYKTIPFLVPQLKKIIKRKKLKDNDVSLAILAFDILLTLLTHEQERELYNQEILHSENSVFSNIEKVISQRIRMPLADFMTILGSVVKRLDGYNFKTNHHQLIFSLLIRGIKIGFSTKYKTKLSKYVRFDKTFTSNLLEFSKMSISMTLPFLKSSNCIEISVTNLAEWKKKYKNSEKFSKYFSSYNYTSFDHAGEYIKKTARGTSFKIMDANNNGCIFMKNGAIAITEHNWKQEYDKFELISETLNLHEINAHLFMEDQLLKIDNESIVLNYPEIKTIVQDRSILVPGKGWSYYHWVAETIPILLCVQKYLSGVYYNVTIYVPFEKKPWHEEWLKLMGLDKLNIKFIGLDSGTCFNNASFVTLPTRPLLPSKAILLVRDKLLEKIKFKIANTTHDKLIITKDNEFTARSDKYFKYRNEKSNPKANVVSISNLQLINQVLLARSYKEFYMEGGAANLLMLFTTKSFFNIDASEELYYDTFAALSALTGNKISYNFKKSDLYLSNNYLWNYSRVI